MVYENPLLGKTISLSPVNLCDAEFILSLRMDPHFSKYLHPIDGKLESQKEWIKAQRLRVNDYYFLIRNISNSPVGTISLYNICGDQGEFGRWISPFNPLYALESVLIIHDFGFNTLGLNSIYSATNTLNRSAINLNSSFGAMYTGELTYSKYGDIILEKAIVNSVDYPAIRLRVSELIEKLI